MKRSKSDDNAMNLEFFEYLAAREIHVENNWKMRYNIKV